jgi:deoxyribose-phosphate aldolase
MRQVVGPEMGVKASGGIRTLDDCGRWLRRRRDRRQRQP